MSILLTNDDGIDAPGLEALRWAVEPLSKAIIVAPDRHLSGCSHQVTTGRGLELVELAPNRYQLDGSPVDCARVGMVHLAPETQWVISGVNQGGNLGVDVYLSGTVAAAREAALFGRRGIAISQYFRGPIDWEQTARMARHALELLLDRPPELGSFWNVNLPQTTDGSIPPCVFCPLDPSPLPARYELRDGRLHYRGRYQDRQRLAGHDVDRCFAGEITVSEIRV